MLYVVHTIPDQSKRKFKMFKPAFQAFKIAIRRNMGVGLWNQSPKGAWTLVKHSELYPTTYKEPYLDLYDSNKGAA